MRAGAGALAFLICPAYYRTKIKGSRLRKEEDLMPQETARTARIEARLAPDVLALVKRAAEIQGRSVSEFVVSAAQEAARRAIEETEIIRLSVAGQQAFADAILKPPAPSEGLKRAFASHRRLIREVR
ncbi:DUF1778 domain-containing protein [Methylocystis sp. 9N]|uniref:DUF1778 domain-containing protein n=1 Tax=Methylocystis borbori TaxID=3118750 RepID=A0ABU7XEV0_9HYPH